MALKDWVQGNGFKWFIFPLVFIGTVVVKRLAEDRSVFYPRIPAEIVCMAAIYLCSDARIVSRAVIYPCINAGIVRKATIYPYIMQRLFARLHSILAIMQRLFAEL